MYFLFFLFVYHKIVQLATFFLGNYQLVIMQLFLIGGKRRLCSLVHETKVQKHVYIWLLKCNLADDGYMVGLSCLLMQSRNQAGVQVSHQKLPLTAFSGLLLRLWGIIWAPSRGPYDLACKALIRAAADRSTTLES